MTTAEPHSALAHRCPFCGAEPGQPCRTHRGNGRELDLPHSRRIVAASPELQAIKALASTPRQALCCECASLRTFGRNYYPPRDENSGDGLFIDPQGWVDTGTLKCSHCGVRTRHAAGRRTPVRPRREVSGLCGLFVNEGALIAADIRARVDRVGELRRGLGG